MNNHDTVDVTTPDKVEPAAPATLVMSDISKLYSGVAALSNVSVEILPGEVHAILGENGAGKSTLMNVASGTAQPDGGSITFEGTPIGVLTPAIAVQARNRDRPPASRRASGHDRPGESAGRPARRGPRVRHVARSHRHGAARRRRPERAPSGSRGTPVGCPEAPARDRQGSCPQAETPHPRRTDRAPRSGIRRPPIRTCAQVRVERDGRRLHHPPPGRSP
ncbi:ATP-binding cassette domain-containing protein [Cryobacterium breve]|uniref:ATP-binding cassette domain-containing protein n=1 Tax=Cryobacterium breve TaxID=1259258 RepID=A0ABY7NA99_9MICO|nr:ATP-binding cassette domain-containing protein [Cryobacterium breve]